MFNKFHVNVHDTTEGLPVNKEPWRSFFSQDNFEFAEIALDAFFNKSHIDGLSSLIACIAIGQVRITLKNDTGFCNVLCSTTT